MSEESSPLSTCPKCGNKVFAYSSITRNGITNYYHYNYNGNPYPCEK